MPGKRIDTVFDIDALTAEQQKFIDLLRQSKQAIVDLNGQRITLGSSDSGNLKTNIDQLNTSINNSATATDNATKARKSLTDAEIAARLAVQQDTAARKLQVQALTAQAGSYDQLNAQLKISIAQYKAMSEAERNSSTGQALQKDILDKNNQLKTFDANLGNFQRNVGNYSGALGNLAKSVRGLGGLGVILSKALGIDPAVAQGIREAGIVLRDLQHTSELNTESLKGNTAVTETNTASKSGQIAANEAIIASETELDTATEATSVANVENVASTEAVTGALDAETVSTEAAAVATTELKEILLTSGIGAIIIALGVGIKVLVDYVNDYNAALKSEDSATQEIINTLQGLQSALQTYEKQREAASAKELEDLKNQIELRKASGVSALEALALDKQLADQELATANQALARNKITESSLKDADFNRKAATLELTSAEQDLQDYLAKTSSAGDASYENNVKYLKGKIDNYKKESDAANSNYEFQKGLLDTQEQAFQKSLTLSAQTTAKNNEELRALNLAEANAEATITEAKNARILKSDQSSLEQRLAALKGNYAAQLAVINTGLQNDLNDPTKQDPNVINAEIAKANADKQKLQQQFEQDSLNEADNFRKRDIKANESYDNSILAEQKDFYKNRLSDLTSSLQEQLDALKQNSDAEVKIINNKLVSELAINKVSQKDIFDIIDLLSNETVDNYQQTQNKLTDIIKNSPQLHANATLQREILALVEQANAQVITNDRDTQNKAVDIIKKSVQDQIDAIKKLKKETQDNQNNNVDAQADLQKIDKYNQAALALQNKGADASKNIETKLQDDISGIDDKADLEKLKNNGDELQKELDQLTQSGSAESLTASNTQDEITKNQEEQAKLREKIAADEAKKKKDLRDKELDEVKEFTNALIDLGQTIGDSQITQQENNLKQQQQIADKQEQVQIDNVNASTATAQVKADEIAVIEAKANVDKQARDNKEANLEYKKAVFDKQISELEVIAQIAIDIAKQDYKAAALAGIALLKLVATKVPRYAGGRGVGIDEIAYVGDGGIPEFILRSTGDLEKTPAVPTLTHLLPQDKVFKDEKTMRKELGMNGTELSRYKVEKDGSITISQMNHLVDRIENAVGSIKIVTQLITEGGIEKVTKKYNEYNNWKNKYIG